MFAFSLYASFSLIVCIQSGSLVSMWSRINAQTVRTRHLCAPENSAKDGETDSSRQAGGEATFTAKYRDWNPLTIQLVDASGEPFSRSSLPKPGASRRARESRAAEEAGSLVTYNSLVRIVDPVSGLRTPVCIVRRFERGHVVRPSLHPLPLANPATDDASTGGAVCHLHRIALEIWDPATNAGTGSFMACEPPSASSFYSLSASIASASAAPASGPASSVGLYSAGPDASLVTFHSGCITASSTRSVPGSSAVSLPGSVAFSVSPEDDDDDEPAARSGLGKESATVGKHDVKAGDLVSWCIVGIVREDRVLSS
jgi:hypothetical protein